MTLAGDNLAALTSPRGEALPSLAVIYEGHNQACERSSNSSF